MLSSVVICLEWLGRMVRLVDGGRDLPVLISSDMGSLCFLASWLLQC